MGETSYPRGGIRTPEARAAREAHWRHLLERWKSSGLGKTEFARRENISADVLGWWEREIRQRDQGDGHRVTSQRRRLGPVKSRLFAPVRVLEPVRVPAPSGLEILVGARVVRIGPGFDPVALRSLIGVLEDLE